MTTELNMFEQASRLKLRFETIRGDFTVEQLWSLPLSSQSESTVTLDMIAIDLDAKVNDGSKKSFVNTSRSKENTLNKLRFDIVIHIIEVLQAEKEARVQAAEKQSKAKLLKELIDSKKDEALRSKSIEELEKELADTLK